LTASAGLILMLEFVHPVAYSFPTLRATLETVMTLLGLTGAWLVGAQFGHTRRRRELLIFGALLTLALTEFIGNALPAALHLRSGGGFPAALPCGRLLAAAVFALAARTPPDRLIGRGRRPVAIVAALSLVGVAAAELGGLGQLENGDRRA